MNLMIKKLRKFYKYLLIGLVALGVFPFFLMACHSSGGNEKTVGIVIPIEHKALNEIVSGFTEALGKASPTPLKFKIENAQGDINMERAIIQQMKDEKYAMIVPVGTDATQMTLAMIKHEPIVSLAAEISEKDRKALSVCNVAIVHDEIAPEKLMEFIHLADPHLKYLTLIHSAADKIFPEVKETVAAGAKFGIQVKPMMATTLKDLYSVADNIPANSQGIFILKDNLIASGISTLALRAQQLHIPLITSDEGSVQDGAGFALGVHEREIGVVGGGLAASIFAGTSPCSLPIAKMTKFTVFINKQALQKEEQTVENITEAAKKANYPVDFVNGAS